MIYSLYIHIPFCKSICPYCDFYKRVSGEEMQMKYYEALITELELVKDQLDNIFTIYIGGGTPTSFIYLEELLEQIKKYVNLSMVEEYTIESTPRDLINYNLKILQENGINRVSIGVETFNDETLKYLKRENNHFEEVKEVVDKLRRVGINNINLDLIYGLPFQTVDSVKKDLEYIKIIDPPHVSYYDLIMENNTILSYDLKNQLIDLPSEEENIKMRDTIEGKLKKYGYKHYEISNYCKHESESIHNMACWSLFDYIGIGAGSHSFYDEKRYYDTIDLKTYALLPKNEDLSLIREYYNCDMKNEFFIMGLRKTDGVLIAEFEDYYHLNLFDAFPDIKKSIEDGLAIIVDGRLKLTKKGRHFANQVFRVFV